MGDLQIETIEGCKTVLKRASIDEFRGGLRGPSLLAGDLGYD